MSLKLTNFRLESSPTASLCCLVVFVKLKAGKLNPTSDGNMMKVNPNEILIQSEIKFVNLSDNPVDRTRP